MKNIILLKNDVQGLVYKCEDASTNEQLIAKHVYDKKSLKTELRLLLTLENNNHQGFPIVKGEAIINGKSCFVM